MRRLAIGEAAGGDPEVEGARLQGGVPARAGRVGSGPANENPGSTLPDALDPAPVTTPDGSRGSELYIQQDEFRHQFAADVSPVKAALTAAGQRTASPGSDRPAAGCRQDSKRGHGPGAVGCRSDVGSCLAWRLSRASWRQRVCGRWEVGGGRWEAGGETGRPRPGRMVPTARHPTCPPCRARVRVAILSSPVGATPWNRYAGYDLGDCDAVVISKDHGLRKPELEISRLALGMPELEPVHCVFVDDSPQHLSYRRRNWASPRCTRRIRGRRAPNWMIS